MTIYDTLDHQIGGFSQQQGFGGSLTFSSQYGLVEVASLPVVSVDGVPPSEAPANGRRRPRRPTTTRCRRAEARTISLPSSSVSPTCAPRGFSATRNSRPRRRSCSAGFDTALHPIRSTLPRRAIRQRREFGMGELLATHGGVVAQTVGHAIALEGDLHRRDPALVLELEQPRHHPIAQGFRVDGVDVRSWCRPRNRPGSTPAT